MLDQVKNPSLIQKSFHFLFAVSLILTGCEIPNQNSLSSITGSSSTSGDPINSNNVGATGTQLLITGGNNQTLGTNTPALRDLEIFAVDSKGVAMSGVDVTFEITQNFGKFTNNSNIIVATTGTNGRATIGFSSLSQIGAATVVATSTAGSAVFNFSVGASVSSGATGSILLAANGNNQIVAPSAAATRTLEVIALDNEGSPMNGVNVNFTILTSGAGSLTGGGTTATATTGTNGRANIGFTASAQTGAVSIVAASAVGSTVFTLQVNASANNNTTGSMLLVTNGNNQTVIQGNDAGKSLEVMAVNSLGLPISGVSVKFEVVTSGAGTLTGGATTYTATTNGSGKASVDFTASSQIGAATILATSASGSAVFNLSVTTGSNENTSGSSLLIVNGNGQNVIQSQAASKNLEVMALNSAGVPISGIVVTYEVITAGSGTLTGGVTTATATTAANGRASIGFTASSTLGTASVVARSSAGNAVFAINVVSSSNNTNSNSMLLVTSGNNQSVLPGQAAGKSLEVLALNSIGTPITGLTVNFEVVTSGAGTLSSATATTNANGRATVNFTASSQLGAATVVATSTAGSAVFYLQVSPSSNTGSTGSILLVTNGNNQTVVKNSAAEKDLEVLALDNLGAPIPNITITFQVATSGSGTLTGGTATATATTDANGKAIMGFTAGSTLGSATVIARSTAGSAAFNLSISNSSVSVYNGSSLLVTNGNNQSIPQSVAATKNLEVLAIDNLGMPIQGVTVYFEVATSGAGLLSGGHTTASATTNASGKASIGFTAGTTLGTATVIATSVAGSGVFNLSITPTSTKNTASSMLLVTSGNNQAVEKSTSATKDLEVMAIDNMGAPISGLLVSFQVVTTGAGTVTGGNTTATSTTDSNGKATITFTASSTLGSASVIATSTAGSAVFNLNVVNSLSSGSLGSALLVTSGNNQSIQKNAAGSDLEVLALDSNGNPISSVTVKFEVATSGAGKFTGNTTVATATTDANGKASIGFTGGNTAMAGTVVASSIAGNAVFTLNIVNSASTNSLGSALLITAGNNQVLEQTTAAPLALEVMAVNSSGAAIPNISVTFQVSSGAFTGGGTTKVLTTDSNGKASTGFTPGTQLGPISVIATSSAGSNVFNLTVGTQGAGSTLSISGGNGQLLLPNSTASNPLEVIATNSTGAPLANIPITFTVTTTNGGVLSTNQLASVTVNTDANGKSSTTFKSSNYIGSVSILASSQIGSVTFSLNTNTVSGGSGGSGQVLVFSPASLAPASGTWVTTEVGSTPSKSVQITNAAATNIYLNSIFTTTTVPFKVTSDNCPRSPTAFAPNATCTMNVQFTPQTGGIFARSVFVNWSALNDGSNGTNAVLSLEGSGPEPLIFAGLTSASNTTTTQTQLNWVAASGGTNTQYRIYDVTSTAALVATLPPNSTSYTVTGLTPNSVYKYKAFAVNTAGVEDGNTSVITVTTGALSGPALTTQTNFVFPATYIRSGFDTMSADINSSVTSNDTGPNGVITYACKFSRVVNGTSTSKVACSQGSLGGTFTFNTGTAATSWFPKFGTQGVYEFQITGTDSVGSTAQYFTVNVALPYGSASQASSRNLATILADYRSSFANLTQQNATNATSWLNGLNTGNNGTVTGTANFNGSTSNTNTDPERLTFDGSTQVSFGDILQGRSQFMIDYWLSNPETTFTDGSIVLKMDTDNTDNGFKVTQNTDTRGKRMLRFDFERSYARAIAVDNPSLHWRMDEGSGNTFSEFITKNSANQLSFVDATAGTATTTGLTLSQTGATVGEKTSTGASFHTNKLALPSNSSLKPSGDFSVEFWVKYPNRGTPADHTLYTLNSTSTASGLSIYIASGVLTVKYKPSGAATVTLTPTFPAWGNLFDQNWHHVTFTSITNSKNLYLDGVLLSSSTIANGSIVWPTTPDQATAVASGDSTNPVLLDEIAFYGFALSSNQVKNHLAAGDHFIRNQALFPANSVQQAKPTGYWRMGETNQGNYQDYSGNQNNLFDNSWATYSSPYGGVYMRTGGSGLDNDGASYQNEGNYVLRSYNLNTLTFNEKFTYTGWINVINYPSTDRHIPLFSWNNNGANTYGVVAFLSNDGSLQVQLDRSWGVNNNWIKSTGPVMPTGNATQFPLGWYHVAMTYDGTKANNDRINFYVNGAPVKMAAATGTIPTSLSALTNTGWEFELGTWHVNNGQLGGKFNQSSGAYYSHDEDAMYDRVLTASEIRAQANEASLRYCDVSITSQVLDPVNAKPFDYINMLFDGTTMTVKRNSKLECALRPSINLASESLPIVIGATTNGFKGHVTDLRVHGSDVGVTVATITDAHKAFVNSADQHRIVPIGNIVTDNLVRHYEASAASDGVRGYSPGCEISKMNWNEVGHMTNGGRQEPGYLYNWTTCTTGNGWNGTGTPTDPYRLTFNGSGNWVDLGTNNSIFPYAQNKLTSCLWLRTTNSSNFHIITRIGANWTYGDYDLVWQDTSSFYFFVNYGNSRGNGGYANATLNSANSNLRNGNWHYVCGMYDGAVTAIYMDGTLVSNTPAYTGNIYNSGNMNARLTLGSQYSHFYDFAWGGWYKGDIGAVHIYNSGMTAAQIKQNCNAQAANYNMTTCAP